MTKALAKRTSESSAAKPIRPIEDPPIQSPPLIQRTIKEPGSLVYDRNRWFVVQPDGSLLEKTD